MSELKGCADHFCYVTGKRKGAGTNGGCSCIQDLLRGPNQLDRIALERTLGGLHKRLAELEAALESTNNELSASITRLNTLKSVAPTHEVNEPDYSDFQTCHENSVILSKNKQPEKEQGS
jgi:hypothetical protein